MEGRMKTRINLLPASYRRQQIIRNRLVQWSSIISFVLVGGWAWHWYEMRENRALTQQLGVLERLHAPTQRMIQQLVDMRQKLEQLQQQEVVARELDHQRTTLTLLGLISQTAQQTGGRVRLTKLELTNFQQLRATGDSPAAGGRAGLLLGGVSIDNPAVGEVLDGLQDSGIFSRVELLALKEREGAANALRDYEIRCEF
jgi:hypothetical protein